MAGLALFAAACSSDDEASNAPGLAACQPLCEKVLSCDLRAASGDCYDWCGDLQREVQVRGEVMHAIGECAKGQSCGALASGDYWPPCWKEMKPQIGVTEGVVAYCELVVEREFACGYSVDVMACVDNLKYYEQALLDRAAACAAAPTCDALEACFERTFSLPRPRAGPGCPAARDGNRGLRV
ncbi:MAG: hypothetical protein MUF34_36865 [Polyangiaceae bacterium]|nr:hypothetical protein [Polyangiaceae bacterium]